LSENNIEQEDVDTYTKSTTRGNSHRFQSTINNLLDITFESVAEVLEHGGSARQDDVLMTNISMEVSSIEILGILCKDLDEHRSEIAG
jgi:hypothetical protein